jgi:hypothetical protein
LSAPELSTWIDERVRPPLKRPKLVISGTVKGANALDCGSPGFQAGVFRMQDGVSGDVAAEIQFRCDMDGVEVGSARGKPT